MSEWKDRMQEMAVCSHDNNEAVLDSPFTAEEFAAALWKVKVRKAVGPDGIVGEHLRWGGAVVQERLLRVVNAIAGSVLSPVLFLMVMDPLLHQLEESVI